MLQNFVAVEVFVVDVVVDSVEKRESSLMTKHWVVLTNVVVVAVAVVVVEET